ncbi:MAG TPA: M20/M25/M40 family metallo-hydrolase [Gemmatimonadales bacterium]|nr:M20/M25/M40 family metallo-hydrolase [Gemmatimonadales bacterium]
MSLIRWVGGAALAWSVGAVSLSAQTFRSDDPVIKQMWAEGMERSQTERLAQVLLDSIGPRLSGTANYQAAVDWLLGLYQSWGVSARKEQYGTWRGWRRGSIHADLVAPRAHTLEARFLAWSPGTGGRAVEGEVVALPDFASAEEARAWLPSVRGKMVLISAPEPMCREPQAFERLAQPQTFQRWQSQRVELQQSWRRRLAALGDSGVARIEAAGAVAVFTLTWSQGWGVNKVFDTETSRVPSLDLSCEDYGLLYRLATNRMGPRVRLTADADLPGPVPMYNVIGEIRGTALPGEYVMLSAHLDSEHSAQGATDNGTGTLTMLEAMRILKAAYPNPRRTILVGHWGGEEQGLIGSRAFSEDHREVVDNLQVLFNQDNGTWRVEYIQTQGFNQAAGNVARWIAQIPTEISQHVRLDFPGPQEVGGSDHVSFLCNGAPGFRLQSNYPDYRQYTWHTNRDTYDKVVFDDLKNNATLAAMLMYLASEDPQRVPRDRSVLPPSPQSGQPRTWLGCSRARRSF